MPFIPDRVINIEEFNDPLGTMPYVDVLYDTIKNCPTPFTIGLFGDWGSGKSSIIRTLKEKFDKQGNEKIKVFIYDAWKYSRDSLRRTLIFSLANAFNLKKEIKKLEDSFYKDTVEESSHELGVSTFVTFKRQKKKGKSTHRIEEIEIFEKLFKKIVTKIIRKFKLKKIAIVIDNIDRCEDNFIKEVLMTVKNFLEIENCVFIISLDEFRVRKVFFSRDNDVYADEYLRKIFNTIIRIKKYSPNELYDFAVHLNKEYKMGFEKNILALIAQEFSKNPRRIIQFLNNLYLEVLLAKKQEEKKLIKEGTVTNNLLFLTKLLIIKEEWPNLFEKIYNDKALLKRINTALKENELINQNGFWILKENGNQILKLSDEQYWFFKRTQNISIPSDLDPFFVNRDLLKDIPDDLHTFVFSQNINGIVKLLESQQITMEQLFDYILDMLDKTIVKRELYKVQGYNILSSLFDMFSRKEFIDQFELLYNSSKFHILESILSNLKTHYSIFDFNPKGLVKLSVLLYEKKSKIFLDEIVDEITTKIDKIHQETIQAQDYKKFIELIKEYINNYKDYGDVLERIKGSFSSMMAYPSFFNEFLPVLKTNKNYIINLIDEGLMALLIDRVKNPSHENDKELINIIKQRILLIKDRKETEEYLKQLQKLLGNSSDFQLITAIYDFCIQDILNTIKSLNLMNQLYQLVLIKAQHLSNQYQHGVLTEPAIKCYKNFLYLCEYVYINSNQLSVRQGISNYIVQFFFARRNSDITNIARKILIDIIRNTKPHSWPFAQALISRFVGNTQLGEKRDIGEFIEEMFKNTQDRLGLSEQQIENVINYILNLLKATDTTYSRFGEEWVAKLLNLDNPFIEEKLSEKLLGILEKNKDLAKRTMIKIRKHNKGKITEILDVISESLRKENTPINLKNNIIDLCTDFLDELSENVAEKIGKELITYLTSGNTEQIIFAKEQINKDKNKLFNKLPNNLRTAIEALLQPKN